MSACDVSVDIDPTLLMQLEPIQKLFLRRLLGIAKWSPVAPLFSETGMWPIKYRRIMLALRYWQYALTTIYLMPSRNPSLWPGSRSRPGCLISLVSSQTFIIWSTLISSSPGPPWTSMSSSLLWNSHVSQVLMLSWQRHPRLPSSDTGLHSRVSKTSISISSCPFIISRYNNENYASSVT
ncbi:hypothetical protein IW262DRAFT_162223 [Armillaria fumosa]|nr:hypothetical protein IW262DRAFT_162223 [Armillaria fumosa]